MPWPPRCGPVGGHLVLDLGVLPRALRAQSAALAIQVLTGLWLD